MENKAYGECAKHKGHNMVNCVMCAMEQPLSLTLSEDDAKILVENLANPPEPNQALKDAMKHLDSRTIPNLFPQATKRAKEMLKNAVVIDDKLKKRAEAYAQELIDSKAIKEYQRTWMEEVYKYIATQEIKFANTN